MDVTDDRLEVAHDLALQLDHQAQHAVRGRMVRAHVDGEDLLLGLEVDGRAGKTVGQFFLQLAHGDVGVQPSVCDRLFGGGRPGHHCHQPGLVTSSRVKMTGSPPTGKSRRCGQPT